VTITLIKPVVFRDLYGNIVKAFGIGENLTVTYYNQPYGIFGTSMGGIWDDEAYLNTPDQSFNDAVCG
jgi:hypothetical protein